MKTSELQLKVPKTIRTSEQRQEQRRETQKHHSSSRAELSGKTLTAISRHTLGSPEEAEAVDWV